MAKIKICGITNLSDAQLAVELGADLLGFNFYKPSPRYIEPPRAAEIIHALPIETITAAIVVDEPIARIAEILDACPLDYIQLHGSESDNDCQNVAGLGVKIIKAIQVKSPDDIAKLTCPHADAVLLDAFHEKLFGGTGHTFDWSWIKNAGLQNVFLAGGINPDNIVDALAVGTYGIDLCSGVESEPGYKDTSKMKELFSKINMYKA